MVRFQRLYIQRSEDWVELIWGWIGSDAVLIPVWPGCRGRFADRPGDSKPTSLYAFLWKYLIWCGNQVTGTRLSWTPETDHHVGPSVPGQRFPTLPRNPEPQRVPPQYSHISPWRPRLVMWLCLLYFLGWRPALLFPIKQKGKVLQWAQISLPFCLLCLVISFLKHQRVQHGRNIIRFSCSSREHSFISFPHPHSFIHSCMHLFMLVSKYFSAQREPDIVPDAEVSAGA